MEILSVNKEEYQKNVSQPFSVFETVEFGELNKDKVDQVHYFLFKDNKLRFALVGGIKDGILKLPFSASFASLTVLNTHIELHHHHDAIEALINWARTQMCQKILFQLPGHFYDPVHLTLTYNALHINGFHQKDIDINYEFHLNRFNDNFLASLHQQQRNNINKAIRNHLSFELTDDVELVYSTIQRSQKERGIPPMKMSFDEVCSTNKIIQNDMFVVRLEDQTPIAVALVYYLTPEIVRIIYWGFIVDAEALRPVNFLSYKIFEYYSKKSNLKSVDLGHSTDKSTPNFGLCNFKQSIGCSCSPKYLYVKNLNS